MRPTALISVCCLALSVLALSACRDFPELEVSEARFDDKTPYPELVPFSELLEEPEATITGEVESELTERREDLAETPAGTAETTKDPLQNRLDALREKREAEASNEPIIDDDLRKRLEGGITAPTVPE